MQFCVGKLKWHSFWLHALWVYSLCNLMWINDFLNQKTVVTDMNTVSTIHVQGCKQAPPSPVPLVSPLHVGYSGSPYVGHSESFHVGHSGSPFMLVTVGPPHDGQSGSPSWWTKWVPFMNDTVGPFMLDTVVPFMLDTVGPLHVGQSGSPFTLARVLS